MNEMYLGSVTSHQVYTYSANRRIEEELKQKERKLLIQQRRINSRILRQKTKLFDDLIQMNVRTPSCETTSADGEITEVGDIKLDPYLYSKLCPRKPGQKRQTSTIVSPVLRVVGANVFCNMQRGDNSEIELQTRPRTRLLLAKSNNICRCLRTITERAAVKIMCNKCLSEREGRLKPLQRARTFHDIRGTKTRAPERRVSTSCGRAPTKDSIMPNPRSSFYPNYDEFLSSKTKCKTNNNQRYTREITWNREPAVVKEDASTSEVICTCAKTSSVDHLDCMPEKQRSQTEGNQDFKTSNKTKYLAESIEYLKRAAGIDLKKKKIFIDSVQISSLSFHDKSEKYTERFLLRKPKQFC